MQRLFKTFALSGFATLMAASPAQAELIITFGGDLNVNQSRVHADSQGTSKHGQRFTWQQLFAGIQPLLIGDLNFANIETVVSDQVSLKEAPTNAGNQRSFVFRAPPEAIEHTLKIGMNLFSMANNHTADYGTGGMMETNYHMFQLADRYKFWESGINSSNSKLATPTVFTVPTRQGPVRIAFIAMTGVHSQLEAVQAKQLGVGVLSFYNEKDFSAAMKALRDAPADYRILSVHWGQEGKVQFEPRQRQWAHRAVKEGKVDLILGHHPHRVQPVEKHGESLIFYSLGNYVMVGGARLNEKPKAEDYGLMGRLYLAYDASVGKIVPQAVEAIPLTDVHAAAKPMRSDQAHERVMILNQLGASQLKGAGLHFTKKTPLGGVVCTGRNPGAQASRLCPNN